MLFTTAKTVQSVDMDSVGVCMCMCAGSAHVLWLCYNVVYCALNSVCSGHTIQGGGVVPKSVKVKRTQPTISTWCIVHSVVQVMAAESM